jgi:hypothetical protein
LDVTEASNVVSTPETAAIPTLTTPRPGIWPKQKIAPPDR